MKVLLVEELRVTLLEQKQSPSPLCTSAWLLPLRSCAEQDPERHPCLCFGGAGLHFIREKGWHKACGYC